MDLKEFREKRGLSQEELAAAVGCSSRSIIRWEAGRPLSRLALRNLQFIQENFPLAQNESRPKR
jgi:transcriptional regulator with XRE-family HTH domain